VSTVNGGRNAQATRLGSHTTTLAAEYARQSKDWETELRQRAKEVALMKELGLSQAEAQPKAPLPQTEDEEANKRTIPEALLEGLRDGLLLDAT
jgi:hypothetical protein